jgi:hypothetical protein
MMKKFYFYLTIAASIMMVGCTNTDYSEEGLKEGETAIGDAIAFGARNNKMTRADLTGDAAATKLNSEFKIYGVKQNKTTATKYSPVFPDFTVQYNNGWYYDGIGTQTIRYWDYSSPNYHFVAGSPVANFTFLPDGNSEIASAIVTGLGGHLNPTITVASAHTPVYIADPVVVAKANYNSEVTFNFHALLTKVRVGIYETIPGYKITDIKFYDNAATPGSSKYITLNSATNGYFQGGTDITGTVTYDWTTATPSYALTYSSTGLTTDKCWKGGQFTNGVPAVSSTDGAVNLYGTEDSKDGNGYFVVMPTPYGTDATPLSIKCDYTLTSLDGIDVIQVSGATATIPADYTKWEPNKAYTYLFKITDNTNGTTGVEGTDPEGLFPITFAAAVVNVEDMQVGTTTNVSTPSITVYQNGNVVAGGITYKAGSVDVHAYVDATDRTNDATWSYVELDGTAYDYSKDYEHLGASGAATSWTNSKLTTVSASKTYVIKATYSGNTAYFVLVVGAAEVGPNN